LEYPELIPEFGQLTDYSSCIFVRNDRSILSAGIGDDTAVLWDTATGKEIRTFDHGDPIQNVAVNTRQDTILTFGGGASPFANLWELRTGEKLQTFKGHQDLIVAGAFSENGSQIFTVSQDESFCVWSPDSSAPKRVIRGLEKISGAAFDPKAKMLVFTSKDKRVQMFDVLAGKSIKELPVEPTDSKVTGDGITSHPVMFSPRGNLVAIYALCWGLVVYEIPSGKRLWKADASEETAMAFSPSDTELFVITSANPHPPSLEPYDYNLWTTNLKVLDALTGCNRSERVLYKGDVRDIPTARTLTVSSCGHLLLSGYAKSASLVRSQDATTVLELKGNNHAINSLTMGPQSTSLLVGDSTSYAFRWDLIEGAITDRFGPHEIQPLYIRVDAKDSVITDEPNFFRRWTSDRSAPPMTMDRQTAEGWLYPIRDDGRMALLFPGLGARVDPGQPFAHASDLSFTSLTEGTTVKVWKPDEDNKPLSFHFHVFGPALFAPDGHSVFAIRDDQVCKLDLNSVREVWSSPDQPGTIDQLVVSQQGDRVLTGGHTDDFGSAQLWDADDGRLIRSLDGHTGAVTSVAFSYDGTLLATGDYLGTVFIWEVHRRKPKVELAAHTLSVTAICFFPAGDIIATGSADGTVRLWRTTNGSRICTLVSNTSGWVVTTPDGRFDTNNLDEIKGFHWVFPDDPFRPLPAEHYLRNYYEPRLLPRTLHPRTKDLSLQLPSLQSLNRARPQVPGIRLIPGSVAGRIGAEIDVESGTFTFEQTGATEVSGAYDLRLFRDGQLVAQYPEPKDGTPDGMSAGELTRWRRDSLVVEAGQNRTIRFDNLQLPHRRESEEVEFSAYAFNEVRIKSDVTRMTMKALPGVPLRKAYMINIGVNDYGGSWDLQYAAKDARRMRDVLPQSLQNAGFPRIETTILVSDDLDENATKEKIRIAIEDVAKRSTPDDLVIVFFSGHGYSGRQLDFYMLASDSQPGRINWSDPSAEDLDRLISTDELSGWFRKMVADEIILIIDACHSAASIESEGFRAGPLGAKGLGQLAYDKRMRVLAASQSDQSAREMGGQIGAGILTYALLHDGVEARRAADKYGNISVREWLNYPAKRVPQLFIEIQNGMVNDFGVPITKDAVPVARADIGGMNRTGALQKPALFDFARREGVLISESTKFA